MFWSLLFLVGVGLLFWFVWYLPSRISPEWRSRLIAIGQSANARMEEYKKRSEGKKGKKKNKDDKKEEENSLKQEGGEDDGIGTL